MKKAALSKLFAATVLAGLSMAASASDFPNREIRLVVPYPPGGGTDTLARHIAVGMEKDLGQSVIVDNRPGANGVIAGNFVANASPDGYTILAVDNAFVVNPSLLKDYPLDPIKQFQPISLTGTAPLILVTNPALGVANVEELVALAKSKPGHLTYASAGNGNTTHLSPEFLKLKTGTKITQIPYKGTGPALTDVVGGQVSMMVTGISAVKGFVEQKRLQPLAVTGTQRSPVMPDVPTLAEANVPIPELDLGTWWGLVGPANLPKDVTERLAKAIKAATENPEVKEKLSAVAITPRSVTPEEFESLIKDESEKYSELIEKANISAS